MRRLTLPEHQARAFSPIARPIADGLTATGALKVSADLDGRTVLKASSYVGVLQCGEVELRVSPKIGIHRLLWLLGHAQDPNGWRDDDIVDLATVNDLVTAVAVHPIRLPGSDIGLTHDSDRPPADYATEGTDQAILKTGLSQVRSVVVDHAGAHGRG